MDDLKYTFFQAFQHGNLTFFGGSAKDLAIASPWDMVINFSNDNNLFLKINLELFPDEFKNFGNALAKEANVPLLTIPWTDMGLPKLSRSAWLSLIKDINKTFKTKKNIKIAVCCGWGYGRTGTALAILKALMTNSRQDPVVSIRESYTTLAVETDDQIDYIEYITGLSSVATGSMQSKTAAPMTATPSKSSNGKLIVHEGKGQVEVFCEVCSESTTFDPADEDEIVDLIDNGWFFDKNKVLCPIHGIGLTHSDGTNIDVVVDADGTAPY